MVQFHQQSHVSNEEYRVSVCVHSIDMSSSPTNSVPEGDDRSHADPEKGETASDAQNTEPPSDEQTPPAEKYSIYTVAEKRGIVFAAAAGAFFSPLSAQIYFPALDKLSADLHVTVTEVNLTVTTYMVSLWSPLNWRPTHLKANPSARLFKLLRPCSWVRWPTQPDDAQLSSFASSFISPPAWDAPWPQTTLLFLSSGRCSLPVPVRPSLCAKLWYLISLLRPKGVLMWPSHLCPLFLLPQLGLLSVASYLNTWVGVGYSGF